MIKVHDKVMIPQDEHPEINFVGLLIGPRGNTLKGKFVVNLWLFGILTQSGQLNLNVSSVNSLEVCKKNCDVIFEPLFL